MNSDLLAVALLNKPNLTLQKIDDEQASSKTSGRSGTLFELLSEPGEVIGYVKTWHDDDDYAGFVHFDSEGNIVDWKTFNTGKQEEAVQQLTG